MNEITTKRIAIYIASEKDEAIRYAMDNLIAQSADWRSRNGFIWFAIKYTLEKVYGIKLPNEKTK